MRPIIQVKSEYNQGGVETYIHVSSKMVNFAAILFMQIRWLEREKSVWEPFLSESALLNYVK